MYLDNAIVHAATRYVGLTLQQSLLPPALPEMDGVELAARYQPGVEGMEVGGDFYVAHPLPDGRLVAAIGDVMGRGVRAAATMGQLRSVLLAVAHDGDAPDVILGRMSSIAPDAFTLTFATLIVGLYDPRTRRLCVASAGHPPPLIAPPGAEAAFMEVPAGPPLGAPPSSYERVDVSIPAATAVVLYTDGLIERRGEEIDDGMERLRRALTGVRLPAEELCDHALVATSRRGGIDDDVAVLVLTHA